MRQLLTEERCEIIARVLNGVLVLCGTGALAILVILVGWPVPEDWFAALHVWTRVLLGAFVVQELFRVFLKRRPVAYLRTHKLEALVAVLAGTEIALGDSFYRWLDSQLATGVSAGTFTLFYLAFTQLVLLALLALRALRNNSLLSHHRFTSGMVFMFSFALLISAGMLLLKTPRATPEGIGWVDALFTATSAVCVTGLSSLDTSTAFTRHGQWVILGLVQLGGLGVMTFTYFFAYFLAGGVSLRNRIALRDLLSEDTLGKLGVVLGSIIGFTFTCEAVGAVAIHALLDVAPDAMSADERVFFSLFHSITAFCSAGFSTLKGGLADPSLAGCGGVLGVVMVLVVAGGIGFPVMQNCWQTLLGKIGRKIGLRPSVPPRFSTNTRIVFVTTLVLFVGGTLGIYATEFWAGGVGVEGSVHPRWFVAMFNAVAARTAGFSISTDVFTPATTIIIMFLMFVGGGPSSTAGGIKTTTLAVSVLSLRRVLLGRADIEAFGRRLDDSIANRALATVFAAFGFVMLVTVSLCLLHPELPAMDLTFEAVSAVSTAGLSRNVTASLSDGAKLVLVFAMFFGRVGVLTCLLALIPRREPTGYRLPEGDVTIN